MIRLRRLTTPLFLPRRRVGPRLRVLAAFGFILLTGSIAFPQQVSQDLYSGMRWRLIGPFRAGRVTAVAGIPGQPSLYYMGTPGGGVWKTTDGGRVWKPIFDDVHVASIGALALAPSDPNTIYVGTGEQTEGDGVYKSTDAGATWTNVGLPDTHIITSVIVDPRNPNIVLVGAFGQLPFQGFSTANGSEHPTPKQTRGVFKSTDGGKTWNRVLFKDDKTGVVDMCFDPGDRKVVYAALWHPSFNFFGPPSEKTKEPDAALYKSTDEGSTWKPITGHGLPESNLGRVGFAVAPGNHGRRVFAIMNQGLFRSDDAGANWRQINTDPRVTGNFYFSRVFVDPRNADIVYVVQTCLYRSTDGGQTFTAYKGAPGGDDYHVMWIDPDNPQRIILGVDQGATVSIDGGQTWSSWYNQPTGQFYHVSTDNQFPYHVFAEQQDSGTAAVPSRSDWGEITFRDWFSVGGFEFGYIVADPINPNLVYATGWFGTVERFDKTTGQITYVFVPGEKYRAGNGGPMEFSPQDPHTLYLGTQYLLKTTDGGTSWQAISPDLTEKPAPPSDKKKDAEKEQPRQPGIITALALSSAQAGVIWVGTSDFLIQLTTDGGANWHLVTPAGLPPRGEINMMEASHHDPAEAYAVGEFFQDPKPHLYRTRDFGKTWQERVEGLPTSAIVRAVREDTVRKGLLYAGTETGVYVSFDDGDHWQSLQLNLPTSSVRDLAVHGDDLVAATFGRSLWILDDLTPLRQADAQVAGSDAYLFRPETAMRVGWDQNQDTPLPPEVPAGQNPPNGAILDYYLKSAPADDIALAIYDTQGNLVQRFSNAPQPPDTFPANVPDYWFAPPAVLTKKPGMNRFAWNLSYPDPLTLPYGYFGSVLGYTEYTLTVNAIAGQTPRHEPQGPVVVPGNYEVALTVGGKTYRQPLKVELDPRVHASRSDLLEQLALERKITDWMAATYNAYHDVTSLGAALADRQKNLAGNSQAKDATDAITATSKEIEAVENGTPSAAGFGPLNRDLTRLVTMIESSDARPPETARASAAESCEALNKVLESWRKLNAQTVPSLNQLLDKYKLAALPVVTNPPADPACHE